MSQQQLLIRVARTLEALNIPWMLTGSVAAGLQGHPRSTHDIDLVVEISGAQVKPLVDAFPAPAFYIDIDAVRDALSHGGHFNLLESGTNEKVDFWLLAEEPYDLARFDRRMRIDYHGAAIFVSTPEDTILLAVARFNRATLDLVYIERWAKHVGVDAQWAAIRRELGP